MNHQRFSRGDVYLIAVRDFVVRKDLEDTVLDFDPAAVVLTATSCAEALGRIRMRDKLAVVFVEAGPIKVSASGIEDMVRSRGGRLVLLGDDAEDAVDAQSAGRWSTLQRPFFSQTVLSIITGEHR